MRTPRRGDPINGNLKASDVRDLLKMRDEWRVRKRGGDFESSRPQQSRLFARLSIAAGADLLTGSVIAVSESLDFVNQENLAKRDLTLRGVTPVTSTVADFSYGILLEPILDDGVGEVAFGGIAFCSSRYASNWTRFRETSQRSGRARVDGRRWRSIQNYRSDKFRKRNKIRDRAVLVRGYWRRWWK